MKLTLRYTMNIEALVVFIPIGRFISFIIIIIKKMKRNYLIKTKPLNSN